MFCVMVLVSRPNRWQSSSSGWSIGRILSLITLKPLERKKVKMIKWIQLFEWLINKLAVFQMILGLTFQSLEWVVSSLSLQCQCGIKHLDCENKWNDCQFTLNSHDWPRESFSLQYRYNIKQTSDENEKYQLQDYTLIQHQSFSNELHKNCTADTTKILGLKG